MVRSGLGLVFELLMRVWEDVSGGCFLVLLKHYTSYPGFSFFFPSQVFIILFALRFSGHIMNLLLPT